MKEEDEKILSDLLNTAEGKNKLAQAMAAPIRKYLDYAGIFRAVMGMGKTEVVETKCPICESSCKHTKEEVKELIEFVNKSW